MRLPKSSYLPLGLTWGILSLPHFQQCGAIDQVLNVTIVMHTTSKFGHKSLKSSLTFFLLYLAIG